MESHIKPRTLVTKGISFIRRQQHDWKVTVVRTSLDRLLYQMVFPYLSIYIVALGASATQLGMVTSAGMVIAGLIAPFTGWIIDRSGPKRIYLFGIGMVALSYLTYGLAGSWGTTIFAMVAYWLGYSVSVHSCATVCGTCLVNADRATGMTFCETVAAGLLGMTGPAVGTLLVTLLGGVNADSIRPVFLVSFLGTLATWLFVASQLSDQHWRKPATAQPDLFRDIKQVLQEGHYLKRWLVLSSIGGLPLGMVFAYSQVYAHQVKGADGLVLGGIATSAAFGSMLLAIPLGRWADQVGRKKVLYVSLPLFWLSNLLLVWAPHPAFLIAAGLLQSFYYIGGPISGAMERELVPVQQMGRWLGIARFFRMLVSAMMAFLSGILWDQVGPAYVFLTFVALDLFIRMPLLISMPETLRINPLARIGAETRKRRVVA